MATAAREKESKDKVDADEQNDATSAAVQVAVRVRPFNRREITNGCKCVVQMSGKSTVLLPLPHTAAAAAAAAVSGAGGAGSAPAAAGKADPRKTFTYDFSFWSFAPEGLDEKTPFASQEHVFRELGSAILKNAFEGYNCSLMAYGQTGSGKSYSMMGGADEERGLIPRICEQLFERSRTAPTNAGGDPLTYKVEVSYLEIYSERIRDLLSPSNRKSGVAGGLRVREHPQTGPYVEDLTKCAVSSYAQLEELMSLGNKERTVAATNMNAESSRSHAVFTITFTQTRFDNVTNMSTDKVSKIQLVDLAGSERVSASGVTGVHLKEAAVINKSLTTLGRVIHALARLSAQRGGGGGGGGGGGDGDGDALDDDDEDARSVMAAKRSPVMGPGRGGLGAATMQRGGAASNVFVPFRDSVLTWLLKDSLGGNSKTIMIATISPADINYDETLSTLRYAASAKRIVNQVVVNEDPNARIIRALRKEIDDLRAKLESSARGGDSQEEVERLREQLSQSQSIIADINRSWEQKLEETRRLQAEQLRQLQNQGVAVTIDSTVPFLVNLNEDPSLSENIIYYLKAGEVLVGRSEAPDSPNMIVLRGVKVRERHCIFTNVDNVVKVRPHNPRDFPDVFVNGERVLAERRLYHNDRVIIGQNHVFRFSNPEDQKPSQPPSRSGTVEDVRSVSAGILMGEVSAASPAALARSRSMTTAARAALRGPSYDWDFATRERMVGEGRLEPLVSSEEVAKQNYRILQQKLQVMEEEKSRFSTLLRTQQQEYKELLAKFKAQMREADESGSEAGGGSGGGSGGSSSLGRASDAVEEEWSGEMTEQDLAMLAQAKRNKANLTEDILRILPLVEEANAMCDALGKRVRFEIELVVSSTMPVTKAAASAAAAVSRRTPSTGITPLQRLRQLRETRITVKVMRSVGAHRSAPGRYSVWEKNEFLDKLILLRELYNQVTEYGEQAAKNIPDPLAAPGLETQLIGTAHIYLQSLLFGVGVQQRTQILDHRGDYAGLLTVQIYCSPGEDLADAQELDETKQAAAHAASGQIGGLLAPPPGVGGAPPSLATAAAGGVARPQPRGGRYDTGTGAGAPASLSFSPGRAATPPAGQRKQPPPALRIERPAFDGTEPVSEPVSPSNRSEVSAAGEDEDGDVSDVKIEREKVAGRLNFARDIPSEEPQLGRPVPIALLISSADRIPSLGIQDVTVKYKFYNNPQVFQTAPMPVTSEHSASPSIDAASGVQIRRRRRPVRLSRPLEFNHLMRHDVARVDEDFLRYLKSDAISFEIWGRYRPEEPSDASESSPRSSLDSKQDRHEAFLQRTDMEKREAALPKEAPSRTEVFLPKGVQLARKPDAAASAPPVRSPAPSPAPAPSPPPPAASGETLVRRRSRPNIRGGDDVAHREGKESKDRRANSLYVTVDVEEMDGTGRYNPCLLKDFPAQDPPAAFRVSAGPERAKRFVITVVQVDPQDFILESCASSKVTGIVVELARAPKAGEASGSQPGEAPSAVLQHDWSACAGDKSLPISLNVWEQHYHIQNKLISICASWPPELVNHPVLRRATAGGERILLQFTLQLYLGKVTAPISLQPVVALKCYEGNTTVSRVRSLFASSYGDVTRLHQVGSFFSVTRLGSELGLEGIFEEHSKSLSKLEHNMRIEHMQQHLTLLRVLEARGSHWLVEAQRGFDEAVLAMKRLKAIQPETPDREIAMRSSRQSTESLGAASVHSAGSAESQSPSSGVVVTVQRLEPRSLIIKRGWLHKRGKFHTSWKRRWMVLRPPHLYYFKRQTDKVEKGVIDLIGATISLGSAEAQRKDSFSFEIHSQTRVWYLQAASQHEMQKWIESILEFSELAE